MMHHIAMMPVVGTVARWDVSRFDGGDVFVGPEHQALLAEVKGIVFPGLTPESSRYRNKLADIDHLVGHKLAGRDIFVTDDRGILRRNEQLRDAVGILVMNPARALDYVDDLISRNRKRSLKPVRDDAYRDARLKGIVTFDYSNNDHRFAIGDGIALFETAWSKASNTNIHAYRDPPSIDSLALAKGAAEIAEVADAAAHDFSSRVRSPRLEQIVIWRNINGLYAATKIISIKDDTRGDKCDELTFEFLILPDGSTDFSRK